MSYPRLAFFALAWAMALAAPLTPGAATAQDSPAAAAELTGRDILESAVAAAGGEAWLNPQTLILTGEATFYAPNSPTPRSHIASYRMWRVMNPDRSVSHAADGKVRILAQSDGRTVFDVGFDGTTTWNERGIVPPAEAAAYWASNFGFGIIRQALRDGFVITRVPDGEAGGHPLYMLRIVAPDGGETLFGIDQRSRFIRYMGFATPRGYHVRVYDNFYWAANMPAGQRWLQPGSIALTYNGVLQNVIRWHSVAVNTPIADAIFTYPADGGISNP